MGLGLLAGSSDGHSCSIEAPSWEKRIVMFAPIQGVRCCEHPKVSVGVRLVNRVVFKIVEKDFSENAQGGLAGGRY